MSTIEEAKSAVAAAEAAFKNAVAACATIQFGNLATWVPANLIAGAVEPFRAQIRNAAAQLGYAPAANYVASIHEAIAAAAGDMQATCERIANPESMRAELSALYREAAPGSMMSDPFRLPADAFGGPPPIHPSVTAYNALRQWTERGIRTECIGQDLTLTGDFHAGDLATAKAVKAEIIALLSQSTVTV